ncbi:MAG: hypothetical protein H0U59_04285 [Gemmatimonadaceae bacterium]|nr:hypothetical protein [Gemmatimonadaceae bacterium]
MGADHARVAFGAADVDSQFTCWSGSKTGDVYVNETAKSGKALSLWQDANAAGPFDPAVLAECSLLSLDADGFTLNWSQTDGNAYYFSWFATSGEAVVDRWTYKHVSTQTATITTPSKPRGLLFFMNDQGTESADQTVTNGAGSSLGICGDNWTVNGDDAGAQIVAGYGEMTQPGFSVPQSVREIRGVLGVGAESENTQRAAFGSYRKRSGSAISAMPNNQSNRGLLTAILGDAEEIPRVYDVVSMQWRNAFRGGHRKVNVRR